MLLKCLLFTIFRFKFCDWWNTIYWAITTASHIPGTSLKKHQSDITHLGIVGIFWFTLLNFAFFWKIIIVKLNKKHRMMYKCITQTCDKNIFRQQINRSITSMKTNILEDWTKESIFSECQKYLYPNSFYLSMMIRLF